MNGSLKSSNPMEGIFAVNKPRGITSHDVVDIVRRRTGIRRVGHGGTLDPMAEGVLVIAVGRENTKQLDTYVKGEKEYLATIFLGANSDTYDAEGVIENVSYKDKPSIDEILKVIKLFIGNIDQIPPIYSSLKIAGKPAHRRVRAGQVVVLEKRSVYIKSIEIISFTFPSLEIKVVTGPGVYIRSLAYDLGKELGTGGYLTKLIRTRVGEFKLANALELDVENNK